MKKILVLKIEKLYISSYNKNHLFYKLFINHIKNTQNKYIDFYII